MQFVQEHNVFNIGEIEKILNTLNDPFQPSEVYHAQTDTKQIVPELRLSEFRTIVC